MADELVVTCDCGWTARGPEDELVPKIQEHALEAHGLDITPEQALAQARPVGDSYARVPPASLGRTNPDPADRR